MRSALDPLLARDPFVVGDGGLATELARRGHDLDDPLWSARLLLDDPEAIVHVHLDYFRAGADLATTASYQASLPGLRARGLDDAAAAAVLRRAVMLARRAREQIDAERHDGRTRLVVASLGSYGAYRADGSEYTGALGDIGANALAKFHRERLDILAEGADLLAFETIASVREAEAIAVALDGVALGAWVSFTLRDPLTLGSGEPLERAVAAVRGCPAVVAVGVNCCAPWHVEAALQRMRGHTELPLVAYPNAGERYDAAQRRFVGAALSPTRFAALARRYLAAGARLLGGCCRTQMAHIAALERLREDERLRGAERVH